MKEFTGKNAFITGGASGIGLGMARAFAAEGMRIPCWLILNPKVLSKAADEIRNLNV
jgi:NAD(P)-dependent dehydrogenase (short-subunit alcohol dehydrogenase family)